MSHIMGQDGDKMNQFGGATKFLVSYKASI